MLTLRLWAQCLTSPSPFSNLPLTIFLCLHLSLYIHATSKLSLIFVASIPGLPDCPSSPLYPSTPAPLTAQLIHARVVNSFPLASFQFAKSHVNVACGTVTSTASLRALRQHWHLCSDRISIGMFKANKLQNSRKHSSLESFGFSCRPKLSQR